jgi:hypothetical protein
MPNPPASSALGLRPGLRDVLLVAALGLLAGWTVVLPASASPVVSQYPFEGTWIRADRVCTANAIHVRTYTAREVTSTRGRCTIRRVATGSNAFELVEECRHNDRPSTVTETLRMTAPDSMTLKRQVVRLKIPRSVRYTRCPAAAPAQVRPAQ